MAKDPFFVWLVHGIYEVVSLIMLGLAVLIRDLIKGEAWVCLLIACCCFLAIICSLGPLRGHEEAAIAPWTRWITGPMLAVSILRAIHKANWDIGGYG